MKYILASTNNTTDDIVKYVADVIRLNMSVRIEQIPYFSGGSNNRIDTIKDSDIESKIRDIVNSVIDRLNNMQGVDVRLNDVSINGSNVTINVLINNTEQTYDISTGNN